jgi:hypothetical protein
MIKPKNNSHKKRDANDVLNEDGVDELRRQFDVNRVPPLKITTVPPEDREYSYTARAANVAQRIHGGIPPVNAKHAATNDAAATGPQASRSDASDPPHPPHNRRFPYALELTDFYAHMPSGQFIFAPARDLWPARSIDARIRPVIIGSNQEGAPITIKASTWISKNRPVEQMTWAPGKPELIEDSLVTEGGFIRSPGCKAFNLYRSPTLNHGDAKLAGIWLEHLKRVYPNDWRHILHYFAHRVQRPGEKINHALVLGGAPGIGKDTLLHPVVQAVGPWNVNEVAPCQLMGSFNGYVKSVMLRVSEAHAPHLEQKRSALGLTCPQAGQSRGSAVPQLPQNSASFRTAAWQLGHCITAHLTRPTANAMSVARHSEFRRAKVRLWVPPSAPRRI